VSVSAPGSVVIIGGGVIGIACAHYLAEDGFSVTIVESGSMAAACSYGNCGYICPSHALPLTEPAALRDGVASLFNPTAPFRFKPRLEASFINWMWQFAKRCNHSTLVQNGHRLDAILRSSMAEYDRLTSGVLSDAEWKRTGLLYAFETAKAADQFGRTARLLQDTYSIESKWLDADELREFEPALKSGLNGGFHFADDASLRPDRLNSQWIQHLRHKGVRILENTAVSRIERRGNAITRLVTSQGELTADHFVLAAGAVSGKVAQLYGSNLPIEPGKGYSITMSRPKNAPKVPMLFLEHHVGISPFEGGLRAGSMMEFVGFDTAIPAYRVQQLRDAAARYLACDLPKTNTEQWYGWRPMTWDSLPIIGVQDGIDNLTCATGHNMLGMSLAPATGKLVAELVQGKAPHIDPLPYSPNRF